MRHFLSFFSSPCCQGLAAVVIVAGLITINSFFKEFEKVLKSAFDICEHTQQSWNDVIYFYMYDSLSKMSFFLSKSDLPNIASIRFYFVISYIAIDPSEPNKHN